MLIRKITIVCAMLLWCVAMQAQQLNRSQAETIARSFLEAQGMNPNNGIEKCVLKWNNTQPLYWKVQFTSGWALVSDSKQLSPIIAYNTTGVFNDTLSIMKHLGQAMPRKTEKAWKTEWNTLLKGRYQAKRAGVTPLIETAWEQIAPCNNLCPTDANAIGGRVPTGCGALSMAQVMNYYQWPTQGVGSASYTSRYGVLSADFSKATYNYPMQDADKALLCYHAGLSVEMDYDATISLSSLTDLARALKCNFKYNSAISCQNRKLYSESAWMQLLKSELDAKRPVIYSSRDTIHNFGHIFIIDGYDDANRVHCNWGWGGFSDGYYDLNSLRPDTLYFSSQDNAIIGTAPDKSTINYKPDLAFNLVTTIADTLLVSNNFLSTQKPTELLSSEIITFHFATINNGNQNCTNSIWMGIYVDNNLFDSVDLGTLNVCYPTPWFSTTLGIFSAGTHSLKLVLDFRNKITELNEQNNTITRSFTIKQSSAKPNLAVEATPDYTTGILLSKHINAEQYSTFEATDSVLLLAKVYNYGSVAAKACSAVVKLDGKTISTYALPALDVFDSYDLRYATKNLTSGAHQFTIELDNTATVDEIRETDNVYAISFTIANPKPLPNLTFEALVDWTNALVVTDVLNSSTGKTQIDQSNTVYLNTSFINNGSSSVDEAVQFSFLVDGVIKKQMNVTGIGLAENSYIQNISIGTLTAGKHLIAVKIDSNNNIAETNEDDNDIETEITVGKFVDLSVASVTSSSDATMLVSKFRDKIEMQKMFTQGDSMFVHTAIMNQGSAASLTKDTVFLLVDGTKVDTLIQSAITVGQKVAVSNLVAGKLTFGFHTLSVAIAAGGIDSDVKNNMDSCKIYVWPANRELDLSFTILDGDSIAYTKSGTPSDVITNKDTLLLGYRVQNNGNVDFEPQFEVQLYIDKDIFYSRLHSDLKQNYYVETTGIKLANLSAGKHTLFAVIDPDNIYNEVIEKNNLLTRTIEISDSIANLQATSLQVSDRKGVNTVFDVDSSLFVSLSWKSTRYFKTNTAKVTLYIDGNEKYSFITNSTSMQYDSTIANIAIGKLVAGNHTVKFTIDSENTYAEANETDNSIEIQIGVTRTVIPQKPNGKASVCAGSKDSQYFIPTIQDVSSYAWKLTPSTAGSLVINGEKATIDWSSTFSGNVSISVAAIIDNVIGEYSEALQVTILPLPTPVIQGSNTVFCAKETTTLSTTQQFAEYTWSNNSIEKSISVGGGSYTVSVYSSDGCYAISPVFTVTIVDVARPFIAEEGNALVVQGGNANSIWYNAKNEEVAQGISLTNPASGSYYVVVKEGQCEISTEPYSYTHTAQETVASNNVVFQHATGDRCGTLLSDGNGIQSVTIINLKGQILSTDYPNALQWPITMPEVAGLVVVVKTQSQEYRFKIE